MCRLGKKIPLGISGMRGGLYNPSLVLSNRTPNDSTDVRNPTTKVLFLEPKTLCPGKM